MDVRTNNGTFTWNNKRIGDKGVAFWLDRFLVSESIMMAGGELRVVVLPSVGSDQWPIILEWESVRVNLQRPLSFEKFWLL